MGLGGVLVRKVFFKNRNFDGTRGEINERNLGGDKSKWSSVKHYFCGDEFNSLIAEESFSSLRKVSGDEEASLLSQTEEQIDYNLKEEEKLQMNLSSQEKAAIFIQSSFRGFRVRKQYQEQKLSVKEDNGGDAEQQSEATDALSTIVHVGDFSEGLETQGDVNAVPNHLLRKERSQVCRIKEEWNDSTLSSNVLKLRIQNRLEAMTRRERALAYAFSQQLKLCSKNKSSKSDICDPGMSWSWLERWMATRPPEYSMPEDCLIRHIEPICTYKRPFAIRKQVDLDFEEKESCGSNEVPVGFHGSIETSQVSRSGYNPAKMKGKKTKQIKVKDLKSSKFGYGFID